MITTERELNPQFKQLAFIDQCYIYTFPAYAASMLSQSWMGIGLTRCKRQEVEAGRGC